MKKIILTALIMLSPLCRSMPADLYPFDNPKEAQRFTSLTQEIRCLICQNESIADSNAPIAHDLTEKVYHMVKAGKSNLQIKQFLLERYGDFVLFLPRFNAHTLLLWSAPILFLVLGFLFLFIRIRRANKEGLTTL